MFDLLKFNKNIRLFERFIISLFLIATTPAYSFEKFDTFQVHGFASQGYFLSSENNLYGKSSKPHGALGLTEAGINISLRPTNSVRLAAQGIYRHAGAMGESAQIDYALLDWTFLEHEDLRMGLRLGRIKNPFGFYNETRDVAFTRPSITLPSIYYERSRNMLLSADGAQLYANNTTPAGNFSFQLNVGELSNDLKELKIAILSVDTPGHLENKPSFIGKLGYENTSGSTRLAFSYADADMEYKPGSGDFLDSGDLNFKIFLFSAQQNIGAFTLTGEYLRQENIFENFGPFYPKATPTSESYYIQGDYHFNNRFKGYTRYDALFLNKDDRTGKHYPPNIPSSTAFTKDYMLGLQWNPSSQWIVQAEYHRINGIALLSFADNPDRFAAKQHWSVFTLQLSYRF